MSDDEFPQAADEQLGWTVTDADGNVVASGPITIAQAAFLIGEGSDTEGAQE